MGISVNGSIGKMRGLTTIIFLSAAAAVVRSNPCQNDVDVYFPDPEDCGRFYMCVDGSVVGHMSCPDGLLWNNELLTCDWPRNVECKPGCPEGWSSDHVCQWLSGDAMEFTNWWGEGPDDDSMGNLRGGCIQLLRKGAPSPSNLDTYYWARAATNAKCTNNDADNGVICEM